MPRLFFALLISTAFATSVTAGPNPQLVSLVQNGLAQYGIYVDISQFSTAIVGSLHMEMSSSDDYMDTRLELLNILRRAQSN